MPTELRNEIATQTRSWAPLETGGMLVGYRESGAPNADGVVTHLIGAGPDAVRERSRFVPDGRWQQAELATLYAAYGRSVTYLGDWHSHPRGTARPSPADRKTYGRVARDPDARCPHPIVVIATAKSEPILTAYVVDATRVLDFEFICFDPGRNVE